MENLFKKVTKGQIHDGSISENTFQVQQVDSRISKNQALQKLYLKHHVYKTS